jgi:hypothetical protein
MPKLRQYWDPHHGYFKIGKLLFVELKLNITGLNEWQWAVKAQNFTSLKIATGEVSGLAFMQIVFYETPSSSRFFCSS